MILTRTPLTSELSWAHIFIVNIRKENILYTNIALNMKNFSLVPQVVLEILLSHQCKSQFFVETSRSSSFC